MATRAVCMLCQIRDCEWCHHGNKRLKFNVVVTTYEIVLKDKVSISRYLLTYLGVVCWWCIACSEFSVCRSM